MAQSFQAVSTSLGEAERRINGHDWRDSEYAKHQKQGYNVNAEHSKYNVVLKSVNDRSEAEVVNDFMMPTMIQMNKEARAKVTRWNKDHRGKINPKTKKEYHMKSVDKRDIFPVGDDQDRGQRQMPYDTFKHRIELGNMRAKEMVKGKRMRQSVLQQYIVGFGSHDDWNNPNDKARQAVLKDLYNDDQFNSRDVLNDKWFKPYLDDFQKKNPSLHVVQAVVQYDERTPHMHFTVLPHVAGKGLGSVAYRTAIEHDHPELKGNKDIFGEFYRQQHEKEKDLIANTNLFEGSVLGEIGADGNFKWYSKLYPKVLLGDAKKRTKANDLRVNLYNQEMAKVNHEWEAVGAAKAQLESEKRKFEQSQQHEKNDLLKELQDVFPDHKMRKVDLSDDVEPQPISSATGYDQHAQQKLDYLRRLYRMLMQRKLLDIERRENQLKKDLEVLSKRTAKHKAEVKAFKHTQISYKNMRKVQRHLNKNSLKEIQESTKRLIEEHDQLYNQEINIITANSALNDRTTKLDKREAKIDAKNADTENLMNDIINSRQQQFKATQNALNAELDANNKKTDAYNLAKKAMESNKTAKKISDNNVIWENNLNAFEKQLNERDDHLQSFAANIAKLSGKVAMTPTQAVKHIEKVIKNPITPATKDTFQKELKNINENMKGKTKADEFEL